MVKVKICGITNLEDALLACKLGADAIGFVFYKKSKRYIEPSSAKKIIDRLPPFVTTVGVFVEEDEKEILTIMREINLDRVQIYRDLKLDKRIAIRVIRIRDENDIPHIESTPYFPLLDSYTEAYGGEGVRFDWSMLKGVKREFILAGGINLDNIDLALELKPYGIDISSGVEERPGKKSAKKMEELIRRIRCYG
ncbi:MAG: phosphoribosylanthranilate isomerase [Deltaproteobacteria bacterium]|nr:phosphoribosylanthranilate isomerase [Deltaproteobacteria bacterium]